ncbi:hypothetical protein BEP19_06275 [Ammoniphilus oxalaticus]|uniref:AB hydrolase-1 domain-containing protein n=1 Tax=Ammoniphilus oxalaticus TaxID=66863 RepID=A0A419SJ90_9BACL|nr:alpha/beta hydrolase [Ammoniphilus oxalaticus]RKD24020.1 hypothetical protein BEP19_06275 [Ammoniphilus oxalaticus]
MDRSSRIKLLDCDVYFEHLKPEETDASFSFLLVHGFLGSCFSFRKLAPLLAQRYDVYSIDLVGFGASEKSQTFRYSYFQYASLLVEFMRKKGLSKVILIGHSMGGQIALYTAKFFPRSVAGLILIGSSGYVLRAPRLAVSLSYLPFSSWWMKFWMRRYKIEEVLKNTLFDDSLITREMVDAYQAPMKDRDFTYTLLGLLRHREGDLTREEIQTIKQETLLIWGEQDEIVPIRIGLGLSQDLPHAQFACIPDTGHQSIEEKPLEVFNEIEKWLRKLNLH